MVSSDITTEQNFLHTVDILTMFRAGWGFTVKNTSFYFYTGGIRKYILIGLEILRTEVLSENMKITYT